MTPGWMAAMALMTAGEMAMARDCGHDLTVWLENGQLAQATLLGIAQGTAVRVFAEVGIHMEWRLGTPAKRLPCGENVALVLDETAPAHFSRTAMGYATVGAAMQTVHIFYYRVTRSHNKELAPVLLGHVFAHEITHVLENVARHSETGVLKAHWTINDFSEMARKPLAFAAEDVELLRARFARPTATN